MLAQVCVCVFLFTLGPAGPVRQHSLGVTEKTAVHLRDSEKHTDQRERRAHRHASQDHPVWSEYHQLCSLFTFLLPAPALLSSHHHPLPFTESDFIALLTATLKSFINLGFHFPVLHLPALSVFIVSDSNELGFTLSLLHGLLLYCYSLVWVYIHSARLSKETACLHVFIVFHALTLAKIT